MKKKSSVILKIILGMMLAVFLMVGGWTIYTIIQAPELDLNKFTYAEPAMVLDSNGQPYETLQGSEKREVVEISKIPQHVRNAFIAIEDERFYKHGGIDLQGIARAAFQGIKARDFTAAGGSTITQQLIKQTHLSPEKQLSRKVQEAYLALKLENIMDKDAILANYLNKINFAYAYGVQSAAQTYFHKDVEDLTISQAAVLAAIPKAPTTYKPYIIEKKDGENQIVLDANGQVKYSPKNQQRALAVVEKMKELDFISEQEYRKAKDEIENNKIDLKLPPKANIYSYFTDSLYQQVVQDLQEKYFSDLPKEEGREQAVQYLLDGGLTIYSTVDSKIQSTMEEKFEEDRLFPAQSSQAKMASKAKSEELGKEVSYQPEGAMVIIDNATGQVKGIVGGREKAENLSINRAMKKFQPGSSTKPLTVYAPGLDSKKITLAKTYDDVPIRIPGPGKAWEPKNAGNSYSGMTTVRKGLTKSKNSVAVQAWYDVGLKTSVEYAKKFGLTIQEEGQRNDMGPSSLALGGYTKGQTPLAMSSAFSAFANNGTRVEPNFYTKVEDAKGNVILEKKPEEIKVISPEAAYLINDVLKDVSKGGTTTVSVPGMDVAGKTGTTNNLKDAWYVGYTPYYTAAVWYGYDENVVTAGGKTYQLNINIYGGSKPGPALMWEEVMKEIHKGLSSKQFPQKPAGIVEAKVDAVSGKLPTALSYLDPRGSQVYTEKFIKGTVPTEKDDYHVLFDGKVYIKKPADRFPGPVEPVDPNYHPEGSIVLTEATRRSTSPPKEEEKIEKKQKEDQEVPEEMLEEDEKEGTKEEDTKEEENATPDDKNSNSNTGTEGEAPSKKPEEGNEPSKPGPETPSKPEPGNPQEGNPPDPSQPPNNLAGDP
ncbi:transglycosylase domain-containing protein [Garciella nitratireducens]|uniref:Penicillin-binding protein 1A n=1 Tax=Garciella nitratireducens DSM 15102 TaxID=1121911 RepID=A0A1T4PN28_9FIRM|nr:transglycosylase domain-containing protein [Garciella nitratireducens]SJZ92960.1 penicillin-binding protein 1A [Garciella nitratireducens DSM 15102]